MDNEVVVAFIGFVAAMITGLLAYLAGKNTEKGVYITKQRESWRDYMRSWVKTMTELLAKYNCEYQFKNKSVMGSEIDGLVNSIIVRLNPRRDNLFIYYLLQNKIKSTSPHENNIYKYDMDVLTFYISKLLKQDWENVKNTNSVFGNTPWLNLSFVIVFFFSVIILTNDIISDGKLVNDLLDPRLLSVYLVIAVYVGLKIVFHTLLSFELFRFLNNNDVFINTKYHLLEKRRVEVVFSLIFIILWAILVNDLVFISNVLNIDVLVILCVLILLAYIFLCILVSIQLKQSRAQKSETSSNNFNTSKELMISDDDYRYGVRSKK